MSQAVLLGTIYLAFMSLGLPDSVLGVAWPIVPARLAALLLLLLMSEALNRIT